MENKPISTHKQLQEDYAPFANFLAEELQLGDQLWVGIFVHVDPPQGENNPALKRVFKFKLLTDYDKDLILHWGVGRRHPNEWSLPEERIWPANTKAFGGAAVQTLFARDDKENGYKSITVEIEADNLKIKGLNYVFFDPTRNQWHNNSGTNYNLNFDQSVLQMNTRLLKSGSATVANLVKEIVTCETQYGSWTLMHRYNKCGEFLNKVNISSEQDVAWLFVWLRYSNIRQLDWQRNYNTKPRDLTGAQNNLIGNILSKMFGLRSETKTGKGKDLRRKFMGSADLLRQMLGFVGKGGISGQEIRDEILHIMHRHHIAESNSHFYEQWHQKLHNNTTPDDVVICEAVLEFLKSNNISKYWDTLKKGGVTKERLQSFERKIIAEPFYAPYLIGDLENYLRILKKVHSSTDLLTMAESARPKLNPALNGELKKIVDNINNPNTVMQMDGVTSFREKLHDLYSKTTDLAAYRDLVFLDIALEYYLRQLVEKVIHLEIGLRDYFRQTELLLDSLVVSFDWKELEVCRDELRSIKTDTHMCDKDYFPALKVKAVIERIKRCLGEVVDRSFELLQPRATDLGTACKCDKAFISIFTEDVIRGSLFFALSMVVKKIEPVLRKTLGSQNWLFISPVSEVKGKVIFAKQLQDLGEEEYKEPTLVLTEGVSGDEEVPGGVKGIILINNSDYPDVLAHVSVRARNGKVLLAVCLESTGKSVGVLKGLIGKYSKWTMSGGSLDIAEISAEDLEKTGTGKDLGKFKPKLIKPSDVFDKYIIPATEFTSTRVGGKSNNLNKIRGKIEAWINLPESIALQFNSAEEIINDPVNEEMKAHLDEIMKQLAANPNGAEVKKNLEKCKEQIMRLSLPTNDKGAALKDALIKFGIPEKDVTAKGWHSIKRVLASKYNERAYVATRKVGVALEEIRMAVLVQKVVPAEYAFVIHTKNPLTGNRDEVYAEVVRGLGETLVGRYAGQAFSFVVDRKTESYKVLSVFNKSVGIRTPGGYMFRSDSNTEDLEGFAGAGLFDSYPSEAAEAFNLYYANDKLLTDGGFRDHFIKQIAKIGNSIEKVYEGQPQDIEGCFVDGKFYVVQTRPQV